MDEARKKLADALVGKLGKKEEPEPEEESTESGEPDAGLVATMEDFLKAIDAKDATAMAQAWSDACLYK